MPQTIPDWATETEAPDWATPATIIDSNAERAARVSTTTGSTVGKGIGPGGSIGEEMKKEPKPDWSGTVASAVFPESESDQSLVGVSPENVPAGKSAPGIVGRSVERTALGLGQFMTSPKGIVQTVTSLTPARLLVMAGWAYDMAASGGQAAGDLSTLILKPDKTPEDWQRISDDTVNTVVSLAAAGKLGSDVGAGATGIRSPVPRFIEPRTKRLSKDLAVAIDKAPLQMPGALPVPGITELAPDWAKPETMPATGAFVPDWAGEEKSVQTPGAVNEPAADAAQFPLGKGFQTPEGQAVPAPIAPSEPVINPPVEQPSPPAAATGEAILPVGDAAKGAETPPPTTEAGGTPALPAPKGNAKDSGPLPENAIMAVRQSLSDAIDSRAPVDATLLSRYNASVDNPMTLPEGYNPDGGQHVFTPPPEPKLTQEQIWARENTQAMQELRAQKDVERVVQKENGEGRETPAMAAVEVETPGSRPATQPAAPAQEGVKDEVFSDPIVSAAVKDKSTGKINTGKNHALALSQPNPYIHPMNQISGFVTKSGKFLTVAEAEEYVKPQIGELEYRHGGGLSSEELKAKTPPPSPSVWKPAAPAQEVVKEPWMMTKAEYHEQFPRTDAPKVQTQDEFNATIKDEARALKKSGDVTIEKVKGGTNYRAKTDAGRQWIANAQKRSFDRVSNAGMSAGIRANEAATIAGEAASHKIAVQEALRDGKPVPANVLADYPDLAKPATPKPGRMAGEGSTPRPKPQKVSVPAVVAATPAPTVGSVRTWLGNFSLGFKRVFAPHTIDSGAEAVANILREVNGEKANNLSRAEEAMHQWRREFDKTPVPSDWQYGGPSGTLPHNYAVIDALERDRTALPPRYQALAQYFDQAFQDRIKVIQQFAPNALQHLIENYFPHVWKDPQRAAGVMAQVSTKLFAGRKEFMKQRSLPMFADGLERGLQPISDNPVDLLLAKMHSMDKFIAALKAQAEFKAIGKMRFKYIFEQMPDGWQKFEDPAFVVHKPPFVTVPEAFDQYLWTKTTELLNKLGVSHERLASVGGQRWGVASESPEFIKTKFASSMSTLWHELGHILDFRYGLQKDFLKQGSTFNNQVRALADARNSGSKSYRRKGEEKMAVMTEAYVHAPEMFRKLAPDVFQRFDKFISDHPELHDLREMQTSRGSVARESRTQDIPVGGMVTLGHWIMPDGPAAVIQNYLSPGLSRSGVYRSVRAASNLLNAAQLGLSAFHVGFTSLDAVVSTVEVGLHQLLHGNARGALTLARSPLAPVANYFTGKAIQRAMLDPNASSIRAFGFNVAISQAAHDYAALAVKGGLRATIDPFWQTHQTRNLVRAIHEGGLAWAKTPLQLPLAVVEQVARPIMEYLVPRQKLGVFAQLARSEMERLPANADAAAVRAAMARAANSTEDRMGQMTYDNLFYNHVAKDLALLSFRAYGWQLGKYRHLIGAGADTVAGARQLAQGKMPDVTHRQLYFLALPLVIGAVGGVLHRLLSGQNPQSAMDYLHPSTGQQDANGNPKRLSLPSYMKDLEADAVGLRKGYGTGGLAGAGQGLFAATYHRLNPAVSIAVDMLNNKDFYGTQIWNPEDPHGKQLLEQSYFIAKSMEPFSISGAQRLSQGQASPRDKVLPFFGVVPASKLLTMSPLESYYAEQFRDKMPSGAMTQAQTEQVQLRAKLVSDLKTASAAGQTMTNLPARMIAAGVKDEAALTRLQQKVEFLPIQYQAHYLPLETAMRGFDLASDKERAALAPVILPRVQAYWEKDRLDDETTSRYVKLLAPYVLNTKSQSQ